MKDYQIIFAIELLIRKCKPKMDYTCIYKYSKKELLELF